MVDQFYKGYIRTKDKSSIDKFKGVDTLRSFEEVKDLSEYAGVLAENVILIDVDDREQSEILMDIVDDLNVRCRVYKTTRGMHFLFINDHVEKCKSHTKLACGLECDIKLGNRNSYEVLKYNGKERTIIYDVLEDEEYESLPMWLTPLPSRIDFLNMESGDGRNQTLFNYILTLQSNDFTVEEARECIEIINNYILPEPLPPDEIEKILRDESFQKPLFYKKNQFLFDKFARYLKSNLHIIRMNGSLYMYQNGVYVTCDSSLEFEMLRVIPNLTARNRNEVVKYLEVIVQGERKTSDAHLIAFNNGIYNIESEELEEFSPSKIVTNRIPWDFNPIAFYETTDRTLNKISCNDSNVRNLLEEAIGYTFYRRNELRKSFILIGDKSNGKSTYLDMIKSVLGEDNVSALDLKELGERFKTAQLVNKLANIGDDIGDEFIPNPAIFKKLVSGDRINAERKGQEPFDFDNYSKLLFSANNIPRIKDKSGAVINRLVIVPFDATFSKDDPDFDPYIKYKLRCRESIEYLIQIGLKGLKRVLVNNCFTTSNRVVKELVEYEETNNPIVGFFKEPDLRVLGQSTNDVFKRYTEYCVEGGFTPMSKVEFSKQIKRHFGFTTKVSRVAGRNIRIYVEDE